MPAKPAKCKLCGSEHWNSEPHAFSTAPVTKVPDSPVTKVAPVTKVPDPPAKPVKVGMGRPRVYGSDADRQRAYRQRKKGH